MLIVYLIFLNFTLRAVQALVGESHKNGTDKELLVYRTGNMKSSSGRGVFSFKNWLILKLRVA